MAHMNLHPKFADFCSLLSKYFTCVFDTLFATCSTGHLWDVSTAFLPLDTLGTHRESLPLEVHDAWASVIGKGHVFLKI